MGKFSQDEIDDLRFANSVVFSQWYRNLIELNDLSNMADKYHERVYYICLWELLTNSRAYIESLDSKDIQHDSILKMIEEIKQSVSEDEYFMLQYYRNSSCHIFLTKYSYYQKDWKMRDIKQEVPFFDKEGNKINLTQYDIREKIKNVIGKYGLHEPSFRMEIRKRLYPIIDKYKDLIVNKMEI